MIEQLPPPPTGWKGWRASPFERDHWLLQPEEDTPPSREVKAYRPYPRSRPTLWRFDLCMARRPEGGAWVVLYGAWVEHEGPLRTEHVEVLVAIAAHLEGVPS